jgi:hypothetical protein
VSLGNRYISEGNGAFDVLASENGRVLPLYKHADIRGGHGTGSRRRGLRVCEQLIWYDCQGTWRLPSGGVQGMAATAIEA